IPFYYQDFREGWRRGIEQSKALGLYRQQYCGCIFSERDRYLRPKKGGVKRAG
ncbi:MAG: epoxyqueuosine reductase QueH, partial [Deltaproteobacteria bacterium]|nr:epoxyqueuosine reductase QueH [Deltaproteobacteria bacterium]